MENGGWLPGLHQEELAGLNTDLRSDTSSCTIEDSSTSVDDLQANSKWGSNSCTLACDQAQYIGHSSYAILHPVPHITATAHTPHSNEMDSSLTPEYPPVLGQQSLPNCLSQDFSTGSHFAGNLYHQTMVADSMTMGDMLQQGETHEYLPQWQGLQGSQQEPSVAAAPINNGHIDTLMSHYNQTKHRYQMSPSLGISNKISSPDDGPSITHFQPREVIRKRRKTMVPVDRKDNGYWEKRRKNNESAKKSREYKKDREKKFFQRACELEQENQMLKERIAELETKLMTSKDCAFVIM